MNALLNVLIILYALGIVARLYVINNASYPRRSKEITIGDDLFAMMLTIVMLAWCLVIKWG